MAPVLACAALALAVWTIDRRFALVPPGFILGYLWAGPWVGIPLSLFAVGAPASASRAAANRSLRAREESTLRSLEAMLEKSHLSTDAAEILEAGGPVARSLVDDPTEASWLARNLRRLIIDCQSSGSPLSRPLALLLNEARSRVQMVAEARSQSSAVLSVTGAFVALELIVIGLVLAHPSEAAAFRTGVGPALSAWVILSTTGLLALPWLQAEASAW